MPISPVKKPSPSFIQSFDAARSIDQLSDFNTEEAKVAVQTFIRNRLGHLIYVANGPLNPHPGEFKTFRFLKKLLPFPEARAIFAEKMSPIINGWFTQDAEYQDKISFIWECRKYPDLDSKITQVFSTCFLNRLPRSVLKEAEVVTMADLQHLVRVLNSDLTPIAYVEELLEHDFQEFQKCFNLEEYDAFLGEDKSEKIALAFEIIYHLHLNQQLIFSERLNSLLVSLSNVIVDQQNPGYFTKCIFETAKVWLILLHYDDSEKMLRQVGGEKILGEAILNAWTALKLARHPLVREPIPFLQSLLEDMAESLNLQSKDC